MNAINKIPLLLLPGLLNDERVWAAQVLELASIAEPIVIDLTGADSISALAESTLADAPERFALAGLSMGGYVAFEIMRRAPERVAGLALVDTTARPDTPQATETRRSLIQLARSDFSDVVFTLLPRFVSEAHAKEPAIVDVITAMAESVGKEAFIRQQRAIIGRVDSRPHLGLIGCPTLILCGRDDVITPLEVQEEMAAAIAGAQLEIVEDCGHLSPLEQPGAVSAALQNWLHKLTI